MNAWRVPYPKFGDGPGLARCSAVARELGIDLAAFGERGIVIVGSNGKGSTAAMCASLLRQMTAQVGLFTSPHLLALNERFRIGDSDISDADLHHHWQRVQGVVAALGLAKQIGGFEFLFLIAADWFSSRGCEYTVWEAGIGGRLDPTKLIAARHLALTSLDLEHTKLLGATLEAIALEKMAAAPNGARLFVAAACAAHDEMLRADILHYCASNHIQMEFVAPVELAPPLGGAHQKSNAALAIRLARALAPLDDAQVGAGLATVRWPGRLEVLSSDPLIVIDVGHTPDGVAKALAGFVEMRGAGRAVLVCGASEDKDVAEIIGRLAPAFSTVICAAAHKGASPAIIGTHAQAANPLAEIMLADSVTEARRLAIAHGDNVYVAGGLFLAAEFKAVHLGRDPASLLFF